LAQKDHFEETFRSFITGDLNRRSFMLRTSAMVGATAAATVPGLARVGSAFAQDATPVDSADIVTGGTLRMGMQSDPGGLDPQLQSATALWKVTELIYSNLTQVNPDLSVRPDLAESWVISDDGLTYTFTLHQATFHNGRAAVAADVKYSFERLVDPATASPTAGSLASMKSIEAPDDATVVVTLSRPDASFPGRSSRKMAISRRSR
jgi:peptide/nickel transport system substrate-binding protein